MVNAVKCALLYFGEERTVQVWLGSTRTLLEAPSRGLQARWGLAMVLPHACALEKEFDERVVVLMRPGAVNSKRSVSPRRYFARPFHRARAALHI
jgi:hypothetical protein